VSIVLISAILLPPFFGILGCLRLQSNCCSIYAG
jgi:hypothetical protein